MKYVTNTLDFVLQKRSIVTLGKFDGLHRGHQKLISRVHEMQRPGFDTVLFTFDVSPVMRLSDSSFKMILTNRERLRVAEMLGIDTLIECPFVSEIMNMEAEAFIREILQMQMQTAHVVVGPDFRFGHNRRGTSGMLREMGQQCGFRVDILDKLMDGDREISSTYVREEIKAGRIEKVNELLGYPFFIEGEVLHGRHLGSTIGVPTINQRPDAHKLLPAYGVYASVTEIDGEICYGMSNIGVKPTVGAEPAPGVETNLFETDRQLYGKNAVVKLYHYIRPEIRFDSVEQLKEQIHRDEAACREYFRGSAI